MFILSPISAPILHSMVMRADGLADSIYAGGKLAVMDERERECAW